MGISRIHLIILIATLFLVSSCSKDEKEEEKVYLEVTDIDLQDIGRTTDQYTFETESIDDNVQKCKIRTRWIKKDDEIDFIKVFVQGNYLQIDITSYPFDWANTDINSYTVHDLSFNLTGLKKGSYRVYTNVNGNERKEFQYQIE